MANAKTARQECGWLACFRTGRKAIVAREEREKNEGVIGEVGMGQTLVGLSPMVRSLGFFLGVLGVLSRLERGVQ